MQQLTLFDISPAKIERVYEKHYQELLGIDHLGELFPLVIEDGVSTYYAQEVLHEPDLKGLVSKLTVTYEKTHWIGEQVRLFNWEVTQERA